MLTEMRLQIDDSILLSLKESKTTFIKEMLFQHAIQLYRKHKLSMGKAAELAGYTRLEFIRKLQAKNEPIFDYDEALKPPRILFKSNIYESCIQCHTNYFFIHDRPDFVTSSVIRQNLYSTRGL
jgi:predicted HTH domain antitoxin